MLLSFCAIDTESQSRISISSCARASRHQHSKHINQGMINCSKTLNPVLSPSHSLAIILVTRTTYFSLPTHPTNLAFLPCTKDYDRFRLNFSHRDFLRFYHTVYKQNPPRNFPVSLKIKAVDSQKPKNKIAGKINLYLQCKRRTFSSFKNVIRKTGKVDLI